MNIFLNTKKKYDIYLFKYIKRYSENYGTTPILRKRKIRYMINLFYKRD